MDLGSGSGNMADEDKWFDLVEKQFNRQVETTTQHMGKVDITNEKLTSIDKRLDEVITKYGEFSKQINEMSGKVDEIKTGITSEISTFKVHIKWAIVVFLAIGVPAMFALLKIAFFP